MNWRLQLLAWLVISPSLGCAGSQLQDKDVSEIHDERANPYTFNRSVAYTLLRTSQPMEASRVIRRMLEMKPHSAEALCMLGRAYLDLREYELAERAFKGSLAEDAEYAQAHALLGVMLDSRGRHQEARVSHQRAINLEPNSAAFRNNLGFNLYLDGRYKQAIKAYTAALARMIDQGWGRIVNITGKSEPEGLNAAFSAKAAVHAWAKGLSREIGQYGITINCIPPGRIMSEQIRRNYPPEYRAEHAAKEIPMGRYGEPEELACLAVFLCSPIAQYITGAVLPVDGGLRRYSF